MVSRSAQLGAFLREDLGSSIKQIRTLLLFGLIVICEDLFESRFFTCPCSPNSDLNKVFGYCFIIGPIIVLFVMGVLVNSATWRLVTGCIKRKCPSSSYRSAACWEVAEITGKCLIAPWMWVIVVLMDGDYVKCVSMEKPCSKSADNDLLVLNSRLLGWALLVTSLVITVIGMIMWRACLPYSYMQEKYIQMYKDTEKEEFDEKMKEQAQATASEVVDRFLGESERCKQDWDLLSSPVPSSVAGELPYVQSDMAACTPLLAWAQQPQHLLGKSRNEESHPLADIEGATTV